MPVSNNDVLELDGHCPFPFCGVSTKDVPIINGGKYCPTCFRFSRLASGATSLPATTPDNPEGPHSSESSVSSPVPSVTAPIENERLRSDLAYNMDNPQDISPFTKIGLVYQPIRRERARVESENETPGRVSAAESKSLRSLLNEFDERQYELEISEESPYNPPDQTFENRLQINEARIGLPTQSTPKDSIREDTTGNESTHEANQQRYQVDDKPGYTYPPRTDLGQYPPQSEQPDSYRLPPVYGSPHPGYYSSPYPPPALGSTPRQRTAIACRYCRKRKVCQP